MKKWIETIPVKLLFSSFFSVICLIFLGIILIWEGQMQKNLYDQQMAKRWDSQGGASQISAFFAGGAIESVDYFRGIKASVDTALQEASLEKEKENARLWIDGISQAGKVELNSERAVMEIEAIGVEGDFFLFHPQKLVTGALFSKDSMMQDGIVIDTETAWQLFGSSDVAGMQVWIGQVPHFISGVVERPQGRFYEAAGLEKSVCYMSLESLEKYGMTTGGYTYEIVMPNPIKGFALSTIQKILGTENQEVVVVENSTRYQGVSLWNVIQNFGIRSMTFQGIIFPYWENVARGYEDVMALTLLAKVMLMFPPCIVAVVCVVCLWRKKSWNFKQLILWIQDKWYEAGVKRAKKKQEEKKEET